MRNRNSRNIVAWCVVVWALTTGAATLQAQLGESSQQDQAAIAQRWMEFMTPGAEHELLKQRVGKWAVTMEMWPAPGTDMIATSGTSEVKSMMDGRYLAQTTKASFQDQPFEGLSIVGFDKLKKKFVSVWIDNFGTGFTVSTGSYDEEQKQFEYSTMSPDVVRGQYKRTRMVERIVSEDEWTVEIYDTSPDGVEYKTMKAVYKRDQ